MNGAFALAAALALASAAPPSRELEVPANDGWVTDLAGLVSPAKEAELERLMESYRAGTTHQIAVLTIQSLAGETIDRFALEVGRAWGMGTAEKHNAALLLVAAEERELRIEVARGLEGSLTDSISGRIIRDVIAPEFRGGRYEEGIEAGVRAMHAVIGGDTSALPERSGSTDIGILGALVPMMVLLLAVWILSRRGPRGPRGRSGLPWLLPPTIGRMGGLPGGLGRFGGGGGGGFGGFGGGGGFSGGGASGRW